MGYYGLLMVIKEFREFSEIDAYVDTISLITFKGDQGLLGVDINKTLNSLISLNSLLKSRRLLTE